VAFFGPVLSFGLGGVFSKTYVTLEGDISILFKIQLFTVLSYEHLTAVRSRSCTDDLYNFHIREFQQPNTNKFCVVFGFLAI